MFSEDVVIDSPKTKLTRLRGGRDEHDKSLQQEEEEDEGCQKGSYESTMRSKEKKLKKGGEKESSKCSKNSFQREREKTGRRRADVKGLRKRRKNHW